MNNSKYFLLSLCLSFSVLSNAQEAAANNTTQQLSDNTDKELIIDREVMGNFSGGDFSPFWLANNKFGLGSDKKDSEYLRVNAYAKDKIGSFGSIAIGVDVVVSHNLHSDFNFHQLYADVKHRSLNLSVGAKERYSLFKNKDLSTGGLTLSNNARPIPQIELSIPDFVTVPHTKELLQVMGGMSYGWFGDDKFKHRNSADGYYADKVLYHRKYGFLKYSSNPAWDFIAGLEMDTQWGGHFYHNGEFWDKGSAKLSDFFKVLIPMKGGSDSNLTDRQNIVGNVYGSSHFIINHKRQDFSVKVYHEHFFEDHSGLIFKNMPDGLYGIELNLARKELISSVLFEYLCTKDQSGPMLWDKNEEIPVQVSGGDNYYNHVDYTSLSNYGFVLGNPLLTSPIYNKGQSLTVYNTRLSSFHGGISGYLSSDLKYRALVSYSRSWGTFLIPSTSIRNQFSSMLEAVYTPKRFANWIFTGAVAYDKSNMIGDNIGLQIKISKHFSIL